MTKVLLYTNTGLHCLRVANLENIRIIIGYQIPIASFVGIPRITDFKDELTKLLGGFNYGMLSKISTNMAIISIRQKKILVDFPKDCNFARSINRARKMKANGLLILTLISHVLKGSEKIYEALIWIPEEILRKKKKSEIVKEVFKELNKIEKERGGSLYIITYDEFRILSLSYTEYLISKTVMNLSKSLSIMSKSIKMYADRMVMLEKLMEQLTKLIESEGKSEEEDDKKKKEEEPPPSEIYT